MHFDIIKFPSVQYRVPSCQICANMHRELYDTKITLAQGEHKYGNMFLIRAAVRKFVVTADINSGKLNV